MARTELGYTPRVTRSTRAISCYALWLAVTALLFQALGPSLVRALDVDAASPHCLTFNPAPDATPASDMLSGKRQVHSDHCSFCALAGNAVAPALPAIAAMAPPQEGRYRQPAADSPSRPAHLRLPPPQGPPRQA